DVPGWNCPCPVRVDPSHPCNPWPSGSHEPDDPLLDRLPRPARQRHGDDQVVVLPFPPGAEGLVRGLADADPEVQQPGTPWLAAAASPPAAPPRSAAVPPGRGPASPRPGPAWARASCRGPAS